MCIYVHLFACIFVFLLVCICLSLCVYVCVFVVLVFVYNALECLVMVFHRDVADGGRDTTKYMAGHNWWWWWVGMGGQMVGHKHKPKYNGKYI